MSETSIAFMEFWRLVEKIDYWVNVRPEYHVEFHFRRLQHDVTIYRHGVKCFRIGGRKRKEVCIAAAVEWLEKMHGDLFTYPDHLKPQSNAGTGS